MNPFSFCRLLCATLLLTLICGAFSSLEAQRRLAPRPIPYSELERAEGEQRLAEMRRMGIPGTYHFHYELRVMPRRGDDRRYAGQVWGTHTETGPALRYEIALPGANGERTLRFFTINGFDPEIWVYDTGAEEEGIREVLTEELFIPVAGMDVTPFDLQMPFLFWTDFAYEGLSRVRGRSSHGFLMYPPQDLAEVFPWLGGVRIFLDAEFNAVSGAEVVDAGGDIVRSFNIIDIKRVQNEWIVRSIDYRDRESGDKTRLSIFAAALDLPPADYDFSPDALDEPFPATPRNRLTRF